MLRVPIESRFAVLVESAALIRRHPVRFFGLGLVSAVGRSVQVGALGPLGAVTNVLLEVPVEGARIVLFLLALGGGSILRGSKRVRGWFGGHRDVGEPQPVAQSLDGRSVAWVFAAFLAIAAAANLMIYGVASGWGPTVGDWLQLNDAGPTVLTLLLKNLTIIPFTLAFLATLVRRWCGYP